MTPEEKKVYNKVHGKAWYEANKNDVLVKKKGYYEANKEQILTSKKAYHEINREKRNAYSKTYKEANKERYKVNSQKNREAEMLKGSRSTAKVKGLEHNINIEDIIVPEFCPVLGIKLDRFASRPADNLPSLDRVDNARGYIKGNVRVISWRANQLKSSASLAELEALVTYVKQHIASLSPACKDI